MALLSIDKLTVRFGGLTAVERVDCAVAEGEIYSIIGPNGAGKTTVFNAITGIYTPSGGSIRFRGRELARPFGARVALAAALVGLSTGLAAALFALNVDLLWRATIKRNYGGPGQPFSYRAAWNDAGNYLAGRLALEPLRGGRWAVRTADGRQTLGYAESFDEARALHKKLTDLVESAQRRPNAGRRGTWPLVERHGQWLVRDVGDTRDLAAYDARQEAETALDRYAAVAQQARARRRAALAALVVGLVLGSAGTLAVWNRARRSPEVISRAGIARTFQNIRLFGNMTARENVLTAMDRRLRGGIVRMALLTPRIRRQERAARQAADELLALVGLLEARNTLARNLPYGDQRRLEIARALATGPQLLLLDEPAAGMNPAESHYLEGLIERLRARGLAVLLIEHHMSVVMGISDRIAVLEYGVKIAEGTPEAVRADPRVIAAYLGSEEVT